MKKILCVMLLGLMVFASGCSTLTDPNFAGQMSGKAAYVVYSQVAAKQDQAFKDKVADLWKTVNEIKSTDQLKEYVSKLTTKFDAVINSDKLTDAQKKQLVAIKNDVVTKLQAEVDTLLTSVS